MSYKQSDSNKQRKLYILKFKNLLKINIELTLRTCQATFVAYNVLDTDHTTFRQW